MVIFARRAKHNAVQVVLSLQCGRGQTLRGPSDYALDKKQVDHYPPVAVTNKPEFSDTDLHNFLVKTFYRIFPHIKISAH